MNTSATHIQKWKNTTKKKWKGRWKRSNSEGKKKVQQYVDINVVYPVSNLEILGIE